MVCFGHVKAAALLVYGVHTKPFIGRARAAQDILIPTHFAFQPTLKRTGKLSS
jgi:hypothetical protein